MTPNSANAVNDRGQDTGFASVTTGGPQDRVAYSYSNGRLLNTDDTSIPGQTYSEDTGINNRGLMVGRSNCLAGFTWRGKHIET